MTKFLNISTDGTLSGNSDSTVVSEKAIKTYADTKQATISDLATIRSGAALGATAVQPGDLAAVATSGSYTDLSNKPTIPSVGNGTITITQGGVSKGTFTTNQSGNTTIALDAGGGSPVWGSIGGTLSDQTDLQNALDAKQATITGAATTIASSDLTANRAVISNGSGKVATSATTSTELGYLSGVTSAVQTQLDSKANSADVYTKSDVDTALSNKANVALDNLTGTGANIGNWSSNVTNCITEIPQDIDLEINSYGGLVLKSGSKLYQPNGSGTFTPITIDTDKIRNDFYAFSSGTYMVFRSTGQYTGSGGLIAFAVNYCVSGSTDPISGSNHLWYDTTNNVMKTYESGTYKYTDLSLPIAVVTITNGTGVTSIDQVFNGFGYIGKTVFALPGVKGLIPDGRNSDGTLKSVSFAVSAVRTFEYNVTGAFSVIISQNNMRYAESAGWKYDDSANINTDYGTKTLETKLADVTLSSGVITAFTPKTVFHAVDYSDTEYIAHQAMPSDRYVDLTFTHGMTATAPTDGYFVLAGYVSSATLSNNGGIVNQTTGVGCTNVPTNSSGANSRWTLPVRKGDTVQMYLYSGTAIVCRFVYANGAK